MAKKTINLSPWQAEVALDNHRFKVINCGRRAGKSFLVSVEILRFATENAKSVTWYISPNYKQSKQIMWAMLRELIPQEIIESKNETELKFTLVNGSEILLKGAQEPDSLRGVKIDLCIFDETAFIDKWDEVWKVIRPTLIDSKANVWFISTPNGFNHFKNMAETTNPDWRYFHYTTYDNPYIDKVEIDAMKADMDEDAFAQEIMGEFRKMSGLIYKDFNRDIHMVDIPPLDTNFTFTRSLDFGYGHKTALIYFAISSTGDAIYAYDGLYQSGLVESQIAEIVKVKDAKRVITNPVADSAQPMSIEQLNLMGVHFNPVEKGPDSVKHGIVKVAELLRVRKDTGKPTLMFNKNLTWIADEFEQYRWMEARQDGVIKEVPYKVNDDACFVKGTKILTNRGEIPIEQVTGKDYVLTPIGYSKVIKQVKTGRKLVKNYGVFISTPNHKVITNRGMVEVDTIGYSDIIMSCNVKKLFGTESHTGDTPIQLIELIDFITRGLLTRIREAKRVFYTETYGSSTMGKLKTDMRLTISTITLGIMIFPTLSVLLTKNTLKDIIGGIGMAARSILGGLGNLQKSGIVPMKVLNFTRKLEDYLTKTGSCLLKNVWSVEKSSKLTFQKANTVIKIAKPRHLGEEGVYNLSTTNGMYFANGVLVSNCDAIRYFAMEYNKDDNRTVILPDDSKWINQL